jgi:hypothetical protein
MHARNGGPLSFNQGQANNLVERGLLLPTDGHQADKGMKKTRRRTLKSPSLCHGHSVKGPGLLAMASLAPVPVPE